MNTPNQSHFTDEKPSYEPQGIYRSILITLFIGVGMGYLVWRYGTLGEESPVFSWMLYLAEIYGYLTAILYIFMAFRLTIRNPPKPKSNLSVDVFVPTYNEDPDLVRKTLLAAINMDYPHVTWLLDDGNRPEMKALAQRLNVNYIARTENSHAKAGNLNNALKYSTGELIAIFDADHAPQKRFLRRTLGYFNDPLVAVVQTPQDFFNLDSYQHRLTQKGKKLWTEQSLFFKVIQRGKDYWNAAFFCGSCAVVRRSALDSIGGFATETVTEDLHTSIKLHKKGFRSIYHHESLAFGIAPANVAPFLKQRVRWGQGAMQVLKCENIFFTSKLTIAQRLNYLSSTMTYFDGWQKGIFYLSPAFVLFTGILPISADGTTFLTWFIIYYILSFAVFEEVARGYGGTFYIEQYNFARFAAFAWSTLGIFRKNLKFEVTNKSLSKDQATLRIFMPQIVVLILNSIAIPAGIILATATDRLPTDALMFNAIWAGVNIFIGLAIFGFTKKTERHLRHEYRFPVPLPLYMDKNDGTRALLTIDNISSNGCKIYGMLPAGTQKGSVIQGSIQLPSGELKIQARVMAEIRSTSETSDYLKAVGCQFQWSSASDQDALDLFLYGSDLQWRLQELEERNVTPMVWLTNRIKYGKSSFLPDEKWATCEFTVVTADGVELRPGLVPLPVGRKVPSRLVTFSPVISETMVVIKIHTRTSTNDMQFISGAVQRIENSVGYVYIVSLAPAAEVAPMPELTAPANRASLAEGGKLTPEMQTP